MSLLGGLKRGVLWVGFWGLALDAGQPLPAAIRVCGIVLSVHWLLSLLTERL